MLILGKLNSLVVLFKAVQHTEIKRNILSYYEHIKSQSKLYQVMVYGCISMIIFWMFMNLWGYDAILKYKLQSPKNIIETCVYYRGKSKSKYSSGY